MADWLGHHQGAKQAAERVLERKGTPLGVPYEGVLRAGFSR